MNTHGEYNCSPLFVSYEKLSSWLNSTQGEYVVTNTSDVAVDNWKLEIEYLDPVSIDNIWNANLITEGIVESNKIVVENLSYNGHIDPQGSISFGLIATGENEAPVAPISVTIFQEEDIEEQNPIEVIPTDNPEISTPSVGSFPCVIFASSTKDDLSISGWKSNIVGDIYSGREIVYSYDSLERLIGEVTLINEEEVTNISYTYDSNSNRTSKTVNGLTTYYEYNALNQLIRVGNNIYTYSDRGNLITQSNGSTLVSTFNYDVYNQMVSAEVIGQLGTHEEEYSYDYLGNRTSKTTDGVTTYYLNDSSTGLSQVLLETT